MPNVRIQLLTFAGCALANAARDRLEAALARLEIKGYEQVDLDDPRTPEDLRGWGSPTILIDGQEVTGQPKGEASSCRVYPTETKVPAAATIVVAIERRLRDPHRSRGAAGRGSREA